MIRVIPDTNSLPRHPAHPSAAFRRLVGLIEEGAVEVLVPEVVSQEWRTQQKEHVRKECQKATEVLGGLLGSGYLSGTAELAALNAANDALSKAADDIERISQKTLEELLAQLSTNTIPAAKDHGKRVLESYFEGASPFSGIKARKDFPDAFLYEAIKDISVDRGGVFVVTADKNLGKQLSQLGGVTCFESLEQLVQSDEVAEEAAKIALESKWQEVMPQILESLSEVDSDSMSGELNDSFVDKVAGQEVRHESIPSDNHEAVVSMVDSPKDLDIHWNAAENYGPGELRIPFTCNSELLLDFYVYYADAYGMSDEPIRVRWADPDEKPFFDAQAYATAYVEGFFTLSLKQWSDGVSLETLDAKVDEVNVIELDEGEEGRVLY